MANSTITPRKGTGFTNTSKYLDANKNNQIATTIGTRLGADAQKANQGISAATDKFKASTSGVNPEQMQQQASSLINTASGGGAVTDADAAKFGELTKGEYTGPKGLEESDVSRLGAKARDLGAISSGLRSGDATAALQTYLAKGPAYTQGQARLDNLLLGNNEILSNARRAGANVNQNLASQDALAGIIGSQKEQGVRAVADSANKQIQENAALTKAAIADAQAQKSQQAASLNPGITSNLNKQYDGGRGARVVQNPDGTFSPDPNYTNAPSLRGRLTPEQFAALGLDPEAAFNPTSSNLSNLAGQKIGDLQITGGGDLGSYLQQNLSGQAAFASPEQRAQLEALAKLTGKSTADLSGLQFGAQPQTAQNPLSLDLEGLLNASGLGTQSNISERINPINNQLNSLNDQIISAQLAAATPFGGSNPEAQAKVKALQDLYTNLSNQKAGIQKGKDTEARRR